MQRLKRIRKGLKLISLSQTNFDEFGLLFFIDLFMLLKENMKIHFIHCFTAWYYIDTLSTLFKP